MHYKAMNYMKYLFKLSSELCRTIAWDAIVLGGNKHFSDGVYYPGIISGWQLFGGTYQ